MNNRQSLLMKGTVLNLLLLFLVAANLFGCATYWQVKRVNEDIASLNNQMRELRQRSMTLQKEISDLKSSAGKIDESSLRTRADLSTQIEALERQVLALNYKIDDINDRLSLFFQRFDNQAPQDLRQDALSSTVVNPPGGAAGEIDASELYQSARLDFSNGYYTLALQGFAEYVRLFPHSQLADDAQFYIGEIYYAQGDYRQALTEFEKVLNEFSKSNRSPSALLKIGYSYLELGDSASGRAYLNKLIKEYPSTDEASLARSRLSQP